MIRLFTKDTSGTAPNGRWYAGDINALQDAVAAAMDYAQTIGLGILQIGESGLQLFRYATGEARLTGHLRTDGIIRGLGGLYAGAFTTTARNAIPSGQRPYGLMILNTTTNQFEWNAGSDPSPSWQPVGLSGVGASVTGPQPGDLKISALSSGGTGWLLCDGTSYLRATYPALSAALAADGYKYGTVDGTHFNVPDLRGRTPVGLDGATFANLGAHGGVETVSLVATEMPIHSHPMTSQISGNDFRHRVIQGGSGGSVTVVTDIGDIDGAAGTIEHVTTGDAGGHLGSAAPHTNLQPYEVFNFFIKT